MRLPSNSYTAWAVVHKYPNDDRSDAFIVGRYWFGQPSQAMEGHECCAFRTRQEARDAIKKRGLTYGKAKVVKIKVDITTIGR